MKDNTADQTLCPVAWAITVVGDRWTVLILRELFMRMHRFEEIQAQTGATPQMIATRLKKLEADGLVKRHVYSKRPRRHEYHLTEKGEAFYPVILALRAWGETCASRRRKGGRCNIRISPAASRRGSVRFASHVASRCIARTLSLSRLPNIGGSVRRERRLSRQAVKASAGCLGAAQRDLPGDGRTLNLSLDIGAHR